MVTSKVLAGFLDADFGDLHGLDVSVQAFLLPMMSRGVVEKWSTRTSLPRLVIEKLRALNDAQYGRLFNNYRTFDDVLLLAKQGNMEAVAASFDHPELGSGFPTVATETMVDGYSLIDSAEREALTEEQAWVIYQELKTNRKGSFKQSLAKHYKLKGVLEVFPSLDLQLLRDMRADYIHIVYYPQTPEFTKELVLRLMGLSPNEQSYAQWQRFINLYPRGTLTKRQAQSVRKRFTPKFMTTPEERVVFDWWSDVEFDFPDDEESTLTVAVEKFISNRNRAATQAELLLHRTVSKSADFISNLELLKGLRKGDSGDILGLLGYVPEVEVMTPAEVETHARNVATVRSHQMTRKLMDWAAGREVSVNTAAWLTFLYKRSVAATSYSVKPLIPVRPETIKEFVEKFPQFRDDAYVSVLSSKAPLTDLLHLPALRVFKAEHRRLELLTLLMKHSKNDFEVIDSILDHYQGSLSDLLVVLSDLAPESRS